MIANTWEERAYKVPTWMIKIFKFSHGSHVTVPYLPSVQYLLPPCTTTSKDGTNLQ